MGASDNILGLSPIVVVADLGRTKAFYEQVLGFEIVIDAGAYAMLRRGPALLAFTESGDAKTLRVTANNTSAQIWVRDADLEWQAIEPRLKDWPDCTAKPPHDRDYGVREIHLKDPDGFLMFITQDLD